MSTIISRSSTSTWLVSSRRLVSEAYYKRRPSSAKVTGLQLGYESRCAKPQAFDIMLGSQLGVGAYRALAEDTTAQWRDGLRLPASWNFTLRGPMVVNA
jgi:6-phosphofructokinase